MGLENYLEAITEAARALRNTIYEDEAIAILDACNESLDMLMKEDADA